MSDIFISYANVDIARAKNLAKALEEKGWSVWWDRAIPPGKTFDVVIEEAINAARCVVVLWSKKSIRSEWVKEEAAIAHKRGILVPAKIDPIDPPLGFGRIQAADLTDWKAGTSNLGFDALLNAIAQVAGPPVENDKDHSSMLSDQSGNIQPDFSRLKPNEEISSITGQMETRVELTTLIVSLISLIAVIVFIKLVDWNPESYDIFLNYYLIGVPAVVIIIWVVLKFTDRDIQVLATKLAFLLVGFLATMAVIWRGIERSQDYCATSSYLPYIYLFAVGISICVLIIFVYTRDHTKRANRLPIYTYFIFFCMYLITCRLAWLYLDSIICQK